MRRGIPIEKHEEAQRLIDEISRLNDQLNALKANPCPNVRDLVGPALERQRRAGAENPPRLQAITTNIWWLARAAVCGSLVYEKQRSGNLFLPEGVELTSSQLEAATELTERITQAFVEVMDRCVWKDQDGDSV